MYDCVIFDVDGTLIDTEKAIISSLQRVLEEELERKYHYQELLFVLGVPGADSLPRLGVKNVSRALEKWDRYMKEFHSSIRVYPGIEGVLMELKKIGVKMGIVTSKTREELRIDFQPFGLMNYLSWIVCADDTKKHKPNPEPLLKFLELSRINQERAVYIGDTVYDMKCAQGAGIDFALALWGARNTENIEATYKLKNPRNILKLNFSIFLV